MAIDFDAILTEDDDPCPSIAPWPDDNNNPVYCCVGAKPSHVRHGGNGWTWLDEGAVDPPVKESHIPIVKVKR